MRRAAGWTPSKSSAAARRPGQAQVSWNTLPPAQQKLSGPSPSLGQMLTGFRSPLAFLFVDFFFFFFKHGWRWNPGTPTCQASALPLTYSPSFKHLYFQSSLDEADAAKKVSHAVRSADSIYCGPHGCMPSTGSGSGMEEDTDPVCLSRSLCRASGKLCFWEKTVEMKHADSRLLPEI